MKRYHLILAAGLIIAGMMFFGCSGDDDGDGGLPSSPTGFEMTVPQGLQDAAEQNYFAAYLLSFLTSVDAINGWATYFQQESGKIAYSMGAGKVDTSINTWTYEGLTITVKYWDDATKYYWQLIYDGVQYGEMEWDNWIFLEAWEAKDGKSGWMRFNGYDEDEYTDDYLVWEWSVNAANIYTITWSDGSTDYLEAIINPDGSGTMSYYEDGDMFYKFLWDADGNGSYWTSDFNGEPTGTWTAG
jgi:hypothetical protein